MSKVKVGDKSPHMSKEQFSTLKNTRGSAEFEKVMTPDEFQKFATTRNIRCELVSGSDVSQLEGKLKTFIDSVIPEGEVIRNKATKDMIRLILWDWFNYITNHITDHLQEKKKWYEIKKENRKKVNIQADSSKK